MFRSYIIIYGICLFLGGIISYFQFNVILKINTPFDNLLYCNTELYTNLIESYYSIIIISFSIFNYFIIFCKIIWSSFGKNILSQKIKILRIMIVQRKVNYIEAIAKNSFRILRSVLIISLVLIIGWLFSSIERNNILQLIFIISTFLANLSTLKLSINTPGVLYVANIVITFMYIITTGINAIILIICNSEYRNAYKSVFGKLIPKNKVSPNQPLFIKSDKGNNKNNINNLQT
uniref:Uncharacterized protein n=1 Tax=Meloidogyne enterolobii TaxID=390850 RepID=A0A6V7UGJ6_MELEN|nr:unnamed protein product [Meloidogyne enterolobii]